VPRLLQEHAPPAPHQPDAHSAQIIGTLSAQHDLSQDHPSAAPTPSNDRSEGNRPSRRGLRPVILSGLAGETALLLGLLLSRKALFGLGMLALFALLLLLGHRRARRSERVGEKPRRNQAPTASC
jgi:hypothetical protein